MGASGPLVGACLTMAGRGPTCLQFCSSTPTPPYPRREARLASAPRALTRLAFSPREP